jgi:hypothetical protein
MFKVQGIFSLSKNEQKSQRRETKINKSIGVGENTGPASRMVLGAWQFDKFYLLSIHNTE